MDKVDQYSYLMSLCSGEQQLKATAEQFEILESLKSVPSEATFKGVFNSSLNVL
jgi:hypothetical protein